MADFNYVIVGAGTAGCYSCYYPTRPIGPGGEVKASLPVQVIREGS